MNVEVFDDLNQNSLGEVNGGEILNEVGLKDIMEGN